MYTTHNEGNSVVCEGFIGSLKNKIHKCMTLISKNTCIDRWYNEWIHGGGYRISKKLLKMSK